MINVYSKAKTVLGGDRFETLQISNPSHGCALNDSLRSDHSFWHHSKGVE